MKKPYIDGYIFGPNDLAGSYNMLGEHLSEKIRQVMKETISKLRAAEKYICMASVGCTEEIINHWASFEVQMLCTGADFDFIRDGAKRNLESLKKLHKNRQLSLTVVFYRFILTKRAFCGIIYV